MTTNTNRAPRPADGGTPDAPDAPCGPAAAAPPQERLRQGARHLWLLTLSLGLGVGAVVRVCRAQHRHGRGGSVHRTGRRCRRSSPATAPPARRRINTEPAGDGAAAAQLPSARHDPDELMADTSSPRPVDRGRRSLRRARRRPVPPGTTLPGARNGRAGPGRTRRPRGARVMRLEALLTRFRPSPLTHLNDRGVLDDPPAELVAALRHALRSGRCHRRAPDAAGPAGAALGRAIATRGPHRTPPGGPRPGGRRLAKRCP